MTYFGSHAFYLDARQGESVRASSARGGKEVQMGILLRAPLAKEGRFQFYCDICGAWGPRTDDVTLASPKEQQAWLCRREGKAVETD